jgi:hypothetical protein
MAERAATTGQEQEARIDLVLEGGGVKGIALMTLTPRRIEAVSSAFMLQGGASARAGRLATVASLAFQPPLRNSKIPCTDILIAVGDEVDLYPSLVRIDAHAQVFRIRGALIM